MNKVGYQDCLLEFAIGQEQPPGYYDSWDIPDAFEVLTFENGRELLVMVSAEERSRRRWADYRAKRYQYAKKGKRQYVKRDTSHIRRRPEMLSTTNSEGNLP